jgi:uncharacterized repeat protein (TIGR03803 family)
MLLWATMAVALGAQTTRIASPVFTTLYNFNMSGGNEPAGGLVQGTDGRLYGATDEGGANRYGTVFQASGGGMKMTFRNFRNGSGHNIRSPLVQGTDGNLYGAGLYGGPSKGRCGTFGCGTIFKITPKGVLTPLYSFCQQTNCTDGFSPRGIVEGTDGNFYGTAAEGGAHYDGTVFEITPKGALTTLYTFGTQTGCQDGCFPVAGLVQATDGNFYGTTYSGGSANCTGGCGTIFQITPTGSLTIIYNFCEQASCLDGELPDGAMVQGTDGNFYGTTASGGHNEAQCFDGEGCGTVFKVTPSGTLTTLHRFEGTDGSYPGSGLVQGTDGNFYGTTDAGGDSVCNGGGCGTVFKVTPSGTLTTLHAFQNTDGANPFGSLVQSTDGNFYGTTSEGGTNVNDRCLTGCGTLFRLSVGLSPFVETNPSSGMVGAGVTILGTNLTGATSVTFNGTAATFTVVSATYITTTVPLGATTGTVQVVTAGGTLSSNVPVIVN